MTDKADCPRCGAKGWEWCRLPSGALTKKGHKGRGFPFDGSAGMAEVLARVRAQAKGPK